MDKLLLLVQDGEDTRRPIRSVSGSLHWSVTLVTAARITDQYRVFFLNRSSTGWSMAAVNMVITMSDSVTESELLLVCVFGLGASLFSILQTPRR